MQKINFKLFRNIIITVLIITILGLYFYPTLSNKDKKDEVNKENIALGIGFLPNNSEMKFNQKSPRNLFAKATNDIILLWCEYNQAYCSMLDYLPIKPDSNLNQKWLDMEVMLNAALIFTKFDFRSIKQGDTTIEVIIESLTAGSGIIETVPKI